MNEKISLTEAYPALEPSDDLRQRVRRMAIQHDDAKLARDNKRRTTRRVLTLTAALATVVVGASVAPRVSAAMALRRVQSALGNLKSAHILLWQRTENGGRETIETWFSGQSVRIEGRENVSLFDGTYSYSYSPQRKKVVRKSAEGLYAHNPTGFSVDAIKADMARGGWTDPIENLGEVKEGGRTFRKLGLSHNEPAGRVRTTLFVDPATDLPHRMETALLRNGAWESIGGGELRYNEALSPALFSPKFPGATLVDADALRKTWRDKVENVVAQTTLGERTVKIRDVQVNAQGAIFLLYTCGKTWEDGFWKDKQGGWWPNMGRDWDLRIPGYRRLAVPFQNLYSKEKLRSSLKPEQILADGDRLQGDWFIPLSKTATRPAAAVRVEWIASPKNLHNEAIVEAWHTPFTQSSPDALKVHQGWSATASLTLKPTVLDGGFVPEYWPYLVTEHPPTEYSEEELQKQFRQIRTRDSLADYSPSL